MNKGLDFPNDEKKGLKGNSVQQLNAAGEAYFQAVVQIPVLLEAIVELLTNIEIDLNTMAKIQRKKAITEGLIAIDEYNEIEIEDESGEA